MMEMFPTRNRRARFAVNSLLACLSLAGPVQAADETREVELKAPLLICRELAGGVRAPTKGETEPEHDLVFFVLAGRNADGSEIRHVAPKSGGHLKIDSSRKGMIVKGVSLWKGKLLEGETVTIALSVREQDGHDSAEADLKEATEVVSKIDNVKGLAELAKVPIHQILQGEHGENDHIGTIIIRLKNAKGRVTLETELGADARYLKGHATNHPSRRAFQLKGDRSDYELHITCDD